MANRSTWSARAATSISDALADAIATEIAREVDYRPVDPGGAARLADVI